MAMLVLMTNPAEATEAKRISLIFQNFAGAQSRRLVKGAKLREQMHERLKAGEDLEADPRFQWMDQGAKAAIQQLAALAKVFNDQHPQDQLSANDLIDALARGIVLIQHAMK